MQWFYDLSLQKKLTLSFSVVGFAAFLIAAAGYYGISQVNSQNEDLTAFYAASTDRPYSFPSYQSPEHHEEEYHSREYSQSEESHSSIVA